jgi:hypothetical protein
VRLRALPTAAALAGVLPSVALAGALGDVQVSGNVSAQHRYFLETGPRPDLYRNNTAFSTEPEVYIPFAESRDSLNFTAYYMWDEHDDQRTHADIRELNWHKVAQDWELTLGIDRVFWGVTETVHLVNIINQQDFVVDPDGEQLLGQPMANLTLIRDWGVLDLFVLPYFRERTFPGVNGRPSSNLVVSHRKVHYESSAKEWHTDAAIRWSQSTGAWDLGAAYFYGTSREPRFDSDLYEIDDKGVVELIPIYDIIHQLGVDVQGTFDAWLWKLEAIYRDGQDGDPFAGAAGFEYTFFDVAGSGTDIGILSEYLHDARELDVTTDNDISLGVRFTLNDINSSDFLAAIVQDLDNQSYYFYVEASRRVGDAFRLAFEARGVGDVDKGDALQVYDGDNYLQLELSYHF